MNMHRGSHVRCGVAAMCIVGLTAVLSPLGVTAHADPSDDVDYPVEPLHPSPVSIRELPVVTPRQSNWAPKFPFPYDTLKQNVTEADITAERDMCQWFNTQWDELIRQIDSFQLARINPDGPGVAMGSGSDWDYSVGDLQRDADIVTGNIDRSVEFLGPRASGLTQIQNPVGDKYFAIFQGEAFYGLWQQLSNISNGIKAHQPDWFTGPSVLRAKRFGSTIHRSHVCSY